MNKTLHIVAVTTTGIAILFCGATSIMNFCFGDVSSGFLNLVLTGVNIAMHLLNIEVGKKFK